MIFWVKRGFDQTSWTLSDSTQRISFLSEALNDWCRSMVFSWVIRPFWPSLLLCFSPYLFGECSEKNTDFYNCLSQGCGIIKIYNLSMTINGQNPLVQPQFTCLIFFSYFLKKHMLLALIRSTALTEAHLMRTSNICFLQEIRKLFLLIWILFLARALSPCPRTSKFALQKLPTFFQQKISAYLHITRCKF